MIRRSRALTVGIALAVLLVGVAGTGAAMSVQDTTTETAEIGDFTTFNYDEPADSGDGGGSSGGDGCSSGSSNDEPATIC